MNEDLGKKDKSGIEDLTEALKSTIYHVDDNEAYIQLMQDMAEAAELKTVGYDIAQGYFMTIICAYFLIPCTKYLL